VVLGLAVGLQIPIEPLPSWQADWSRPGIGFDDAPAVFSSVPTKLVYTNSHLERYPFLDLLHVDDSVAQKFSFALCSEVLEHVPPPAVTAATGLLNLLQPGGCAVVSVPLLGSGSTHEYYPNLKDFQVRGGHVEWTDIDGKTRIDTSPDFHLGTGLVLAFRLFCMTGLKNLLVEAGFERIIDLPIYPEFGVSEIANHGVVVAWKKA
jgi:hypothetical protein